ncbi:unnamed protein product [Rotaria sp. Silwood1]|nr:unnamed protein product [Rotaria sp. Silwood1]
MLIVARQKQRSKSSSQHPVQTRNGNNDTNSTGPDDEDFATRVNGAIINDSENDTYFLILYLGTAIFSYSVNPDIVRMVVYGSIYLTARTLHSTMYALGFQLPRTMSYLAGLLCTFAISLDLVITMSRSSN